MKHEYDFTNAEQGKFYRPLEELDIPIYLDQDVKEFFFHHLPSITKSWSLQDMVNSLIKQNIAISRKLLPEQKG